MDLCGNSVESAIVLESKRSNRMQGFAKVTLTKVQFLTLNPESSHSCTRMDCITVSVMCPRYCRFALSPNNKTRMWKTNMYGSVQSDEALSKYFRVATEYNILSRAALKHA